MISQYFKISNPATGRFINGGNQMNNLPVMVDPAGMFIAPLSLLPLMFGGKKKKKRGKWDWLIVALVMCVALAGSLTGCNSEDLNSGELQMPTNPISGYSELINNATVMSQHPEEVVPPIDLPFIQCLSPFLFSTKISEYAFYKEWNLMGRLPDLRGIDYAVLYVNPHGNYYGVDPILVAAGIAVQSEGYNPLTDSRDSWLLKLFGKSSIDSGMGIAQVSDKDMRHYLGLTFYDQMDPEIAAKAMAKRIALVWDVLDDAVIGEKAKIQPKDRFIAAAMAQNGMGFDYGDMYDVVYYTGKDDDNTLNWPKYIRDRNKTTLSASTVSPYIRENLTGLQFDTQLELQMFINDIRELYKLGFELPVGLGMDEIESIESDLCPRSF